MQGEVECDDWELVLLEGRVGAGREGLEVSW